MKYPDTAIGPSTDLWLENWTEIPMFFTGKDVGVKLTSGSPERAIRNLSTGQIIQWNLEKLVGYKEPYWGTVTTAYQCPLCEHIDSGFNFLIRHLYQKHNSLVYELWWNEYRYVYDLLGCYHPIESYKRGRFIAPNG